MDLFVESFEVGQLVRDVEAIVHQTLFNLLSNAAKFTNHGTITLHVASDGDRSPGSSTSTESDVRRAG